jgi:hypothetical protein
MRTVNAPSHMPAKRCRTAALNGAHDFELVQADVPHCPAVVCLQTMRGGVCRTPGGTMVTEDIRDLQ